MEGDKMRQIIEIELEDSIIDKLKEFGEPRGFSLEETIRFMVGEEINYQTDLVEKKLPTMNQSSGVSGYSNFNPFKLPPRDEITSFNIDEILQKTAQIVTAANEPKCKGCTQLLTAQDVLNGCCGKCGERI